MLRDHVIGFPPYLSARRSGPSPLLPAIHKKATPPLSHSYNVLQKMGHICGAFIAALEIVPKPQNHDETDSAHCDPSQFVAIHYIAFHTMYIW